MFRRITVSLLTVGLLGAFGILTLTPVARAEWTVDTTTRGAQPAGDAQAARPLPTIESMEALLEKGELPQAEQDYLQWSNIWQEDDAELFIKIETAILLKQYADGKGDAFVALVRAGDPTALEQLRAGTAKLSLKERVAAIRALGAHGGAADLIAVTQLLQNPDPQIAGAAIQTIGEIGNLTSLRDLSFAARTANLPNSLYIAKAMMALGASKLLRERYSEQLTFPFENVVERANLMLAVGGASKSWSFVKKVLDGKTEPYYPVALSILGNLRLDDVQPYVQKGLQGSEAEKLAALQSIAALPDEIIDLTLIGMVLQVNPETNEITPLKLSNQPNSVRLAAIEQLGTRYTEASESALRQIATTTQKLDSQVIAAAILALSRNDLLADENLRTSIRMQIARDDATIALAARTALLNYAMHH